MPKHALNRGTSGRSGNLVVPPVHLLKVTQVASQCQDKLNCESKNGNKCGKGISSKKEEEQWSERKNRGKNEKMYYFPHAKKGRQKKWSREKGEKHREGDKQCDMKRRS